jgi:carbon monoxide dehydrogenase subunit G
MEPFTVSTTIERPREEVYEYLADIANHAEFSDHYLVDWHLTRTNTYGEGAGARFRAKAPLQRFAWADTVIADMQPPYKILQHGRGGKYNRIRMLGVYTLQPTSNGGTRVQYTFETEPSQLSDKLMENLIVRSWTKRNAARAMRRLRSILEDGKRRGERASYEVE